MLFESGAVAPTGAIAGNANDEDPARYEPHYDEIRSADQVQIYESVMVDLRGTPTTGLLQGVRYVKDNRLLPRGFDKSTASADVAVHGAATGDADFQSGGDRVRYAIDVSKAQGPVTLEAELRFQTISFRWARNLGDLRRSRDEALRLLLRLHGAGIVARASPAQRRRSTDRGSPSPSEIVVSGQVWVRRLPSHPKSCTSPSDSTKAINSRFLHVLVYLLCTSIRQFERIVRP